MLFFAESNLKYNIKAAAASCNKNNLKQIFLIDIY